MATITQYWRGKISTTNYDAFGQPYGSSSSMYQSPSRDWDSSVSKANLPSWRDLVRRHMQATNPYSRTESTCRVLPGKIDTWTDVGAGNKQFETVSGDIAFPSSAAFFAAKRIADLQNRVHLKWLGKANKELRTLSGGVSVGELRESIHAFKHPLESLKKGLHEYLVEAPKRARPSKGLKMSQRRRTIAKAISGTYLEYANGWKPLALDVEKAARTLAEHFAAPGISYSRVTAGEKAQERNSSRQITAFSSTGSPSASWHRHQDVTFVSGCLYVGEVRVSHTGSASDLLRSSGFTLNEFVPTIWELLPLSYVTDYFFNVGNLLEGFAFLSGNRTWWSCSFKDEANGTVQGVVRNPEHSGVLSRTGNPGSCRIRSVAFTRVVPDGFSPSLEFQLPERFLGSKLANTTSLLVQMRTSSRQLSRLLNG